MALTKVTGAGLGTIKDDIILNSDSSVIHFGADSDVTITHDPDDGLIIKSKATADDNRVLLTLQTGETDVVKDDVLGSIAFQAPDEAGGTDAILVAAEVQAVAQGTFSSSINDTALVFKTGYSGATTEKMRIASEGAVLIGETDDKYLEAYGGSNTNGLFITASNGAFIGMGRDATDNEDFIAGIHFHNLNNGDYDAQDADGQLVAWIRCKSITSDNNA